MLVNKLVRWSCYDVLCGVVACLMCTSMFGKHSAFALQSYITIFWLTYLTQCMYSGGWLMVVTIALNWMNDKCGGGMASCDVRDLNHIPITLHFG